MGSFLMFFGTAILGVPGALMGLAVGIGTIWDATTDPVVGHLSDKTRSRFFGKRHGYILFGCIAVAIVNYMIWSISPDWSLGAKFLILTSLLLLIETFNTLYSTPYGALGLDLAKTYDERTAIQGFKTVFSFLSLMVPFILMTLFLSPQSYVTMSATTEGYQKIALFTSILCVICGLICFIGTYKHRHSTTQPNFSPEGLKSGIKSDNNIKSIFSNFFSIIKQKNVALLIAGYAISLSAGAFITSLGLHVFTYTFGFSTIQIPLIMASLIGGIVLGQPFWFRLSRKTDKPTALMYALITVLIGISIFAIILTIRNQIPIELVMPLIALSVFICGAGTGCLYSLPISMFADLIDLNNKKTGIDKTASAAGFLTFCTKISNAFIMFIIGISLDLVGFVGSNATQTLLTQNWLGALLVIGVTLAAISSIFIYSKYSYNKEDFD